MNTIFRLLQLVPLVSVFFFCGLLSAKAANAVDHMPGMGAQSPIDIRSDATYFGRLPALQFNFSSNTNLDVTNTGAPAMDATVRADVAAGAGSVTLGGDTYNLSQFHFSAPGEHLLNGQRSAMEVHLVFADASNNLLVVGRWINQGSFNSALDPIFSDLPQKTGDHLAVNSFNLNSLLPENLESFRYTGSLPGTSFTEGVKWANLAQPLEMSAAQIQNFQTLFPMGNAHPVQPLNGRIILTDVPGFVTAVPEPETYAMLLAGLVLIGFITRRRFANPGFMNSIA